MRDIQRAFILEMLRSTNFNKVLSGVRECSRMLERAAAMCRQWAGEMQPPLLPLKVGHR